MLEFFRGWKRKAGCVTLVLACLMTAAWIRSHLVHDWVEWENGPSFEARSIAGLLTKSNSLNIISYVISQKPKAIDVEDDLPLIRHDPSLWWLFSSPTYQSSAQILVAYEDSSAQPTTIPPRAISPAVPMPVISLTLPFWLIVIPLTALSAWLLLSKSYTKIAPVTAPPHEEP